MNHYCVQSYSFFRTFVHLRKLFFRRKERFSEKTQLMENNKACQNAFFNLFFAKCIPSKKKNVLLHQKQLNNLYNDKEKSTFSKHTDGMLLRNECTGNVPFWLSHQPAGDKV